MWLLLLFIVTFLVGVLCGFASKQLVDEKARLAATRGLDGEDDIDDDIDDDFLST
jgi:hypothetical protein